MRRMVSTRPAFGPLKKQEYKETVSPFVSPSEEKARKVFEMRKSKAAAAACGGSAAGEVVDAIEGGAPASVI